MYIFKRLYFLYNCLYSSVILQQRDVNSLKEISARFAYAEQRHTIAVLNSLWQREPDLGVVELLDLRSAAIASLDYLHFDYLDGVSSGAMTSSHVAVALRHSSAHGQVSVLSVHVVSTGTRVVSQPDAKVLDLDRRLLCDLKIHLNRLKIINT